MEYRDDAFGPLVYSRDQVLLLFSDSEDGLADARTAARNAGCRIAGELAIDAGATRLEPPVGADAALVSASHASEALDRLLGRLGRHVRDGTMRGLVTSPFALIDTVAAADLPSDIEYYVDPDPVELELAIAAAVAPGEARVHEAGRGQVAILQQLSEEAARIAAMLASLSAAERAGGPAAAVAEEPAVPASAVRAIIRARRLRDQYFPAEMFADPGFDMLLDLYAAGLEGNRVAVSSLCIAAAVPATTALRWIRALTDQGLFVRSADPNDGRRVYISLSDAAATAMGRYLVAVQRGGTMPV